MRTHVATRFGDGALRSLSFVIHHNRPMTRMVSTSGAPDHEDVQLGRRRCQVAWMDSRSTADPNRDRARRMNGMA
jgi:hypothetical protein